MIGSWLRFVIGLLISVGIIYEIAIGAVIPEFLIILAIVYILLSVMFFVQKYLMKM